MTDHKRASNTSISEPGNSSSVSKNLARFHRDSGPKTLVLSHRIQESRSSTFCCIIRYTVQLDVALCRTLYFCVGSDTNVVLRCFMRESQKQIAITRL